MTINEMTIRIGGAAGDGVESSGAGFCQALARGGLHVFGLPDYYSRIRGRPSLRGRLPDDARLAWRHYKQNLFRGAWENARRRNGMKEKLVCDNCREEIEAGDELVRRGSKVYCCEACAFEAGRSKDCGGRADSHLKPIVEERM